MELRETSNVFPAGTDSWQRADSFAALALFLGTALVVIWQNFRLGVLWDLSYILENAHRISLGDVPYRDFPFPYAPITFLIQAGIIKLTGHAYFHHVIYSALAGGAATIISWRILLNVLLGEVRSARLVAFLLTVPLMVLGVYCIYPHPFYDPDCTIFILIGILLLQRLDSRDVTPISAFFCGAALVVPLFVKQNTGLFFLASTAAAIAVLIGTDARRARRVAGYLWIGAGAASLLAVVLLLIHTFAGLRNYWHWTFQFAAQRRAPDFHDILEQFENDALALWIALVAAGGILAVFISRHVNRGPHLDSVSQQSKLISAFRLIAVILTSAPFVWTVVYLFLDDDPSSRAERLLALWPVFLIISAVVAFLRIPSRSGIKLILPFILICVIEGAFLSQQLWGSTYALWPFLMILIAMFVGDLASSSSRSQSWIAVPLASVIAISLLVSGGFYVWSHERLDYVDLWDGLPVRSTLPSLAGLRLRGPWIPQFEEFVRFSEKEIPHDDGLIMIPGEDLFYYSTGRHPRFPVIMFDHTVNPYSPEQVLALCSAKNIRWLVVKRNLQMQGKPYEDESQTIQLLQREFQPMGHLENYDVYKRK
jgi:hypothetical protein